MPSDFTHLKPEGGAKMVDVSEKQPTFRTATAQADVIVSMETFKAIQNRQVKKGDVLEVARIAGIMAVKRTPEMIPLCHPVSIRSVDLHLRLDEEDQLIHIQATVKAFDVTGVEMEALTAATTAALTVYDMVKSIERGVHIGNIYLLEKSGGRSGAYNAGSGEPQSGSSEGGGGGSKRRRRRGGSGRRRGSGNGGSSAPPEQHN